MFGRRTIWGRCNILLTRYQRLHKKAFRRLSTNDLWSACWGRWRERLFACALPPPSSRLLDLYFFLSYCGRLFIGPDCRICLFSTGGATPRYTPPCLTRLSPVMFTPGLCACASMAIIMFIPSFCFIAPFLLIGLPLVNYHVFFMRDLFVFGKRKRLGGWRDMGHSGD